MSLPEIKFVDFSGGMVTAINPVLAPKNSFKTVLNVDLWTKAGSIKPIKKLVNKLNLSATKSYDHHVKLSSPDIGDIVFIMMDDGEILTFNGTELSHIADVSEVSVMTSVGDKVYVFGRGVTPVPPGEPMHTRKVIYYDKDVEDFVVKSLLIKDSLVVHEGPTEISNDIVGYDDDLDFILQITSNFDGAESTGIKIVSDILGGREHFVIIKIDPEDDQGFDGASRAYFSFRKRLSSEDFLSPQLVFDINGKNDDEGSFVPFISGRITDGTFAAPHYNDEYILVWDKVYHAEEGQYETFTTLTTLLNRVLYGYSGHIRTRSLHGKGSYVSVNYQKFEIIDITYDDTSIPYSSFYALKMDRSVGNLYITDQFNSLSFRDTAHIMFEVELFWWQNTFYVPISRKFRDLLTVPIDENRPETVYKSGIGNAIAFAGNKLFIANPFYPDFRRGPDYEPVEYNGFISWNFITGEGRHAYPLIPDTNLLSPPISGSTIVDIFPWQDTLFILQDSGISRLKIGADSVSFIQSARYGAMSKYQYYTDENNMFLAFGGKIYAGAIDKSNYEAGKFDFAEISKQISNLFDVNGDFRLAYDVYNDLLYVSDLNDQNNHYICSFYSGPPTWVKFTNDPPLHILGSFVIGGNIYFIAQELLTGTYGIYEYGSEILGTIHVISNDIYYEMENAYAKKVELLYKKVAGNVDFHLVLDGEEVVVENLPNKSEVDFHEVKIPYTSKTRFNRISWELDGSGLDDNFEFCGVFINRGTYGSEYLRGY